MSSIEDELTGLHNRRSFLTLLRRHIGFANERGTNLALLVVDIDGFARLNATHGYEFGDQALRPLTLREVAAEVGLHESTISRAIARKYVRTPRGTMPLRAFFASGIDTGGGGEASSTAIQAMIRRLIEAEDPRKPLSDARLADMLKAAGVPVARRTVAKYREAMHIPSSQDRLRIA